MSEISPEFSRKTFQSWKDQYRSVITDDPHAGLQSDGERANNFFLIDTIYGIARVGKANMAKMLLDKYVGISKRPATKKEVAIICAISLKNDRSNGMQGLYWSLACVLEIKFGVNDVSGAELQRVEWETQRKLNFDTHIMSFDDVISGLLYGMIPESDRERTEDWRKRILCVALTMAEFVLKAKSAASFCMMDNAIGSIYWAFCFVGVLPIRGQELFPTATDKNIEKFNSHVRDLLVKLYRRDMPQAPLHPGGKLQPLALLSEITGHGFNDLLDRFFRVVKIAAKKINEEENSAMNRRFPPSPSEAPTNCSGLSSTRFSLSSRESLTVDDEPTEMNNNAGVGKSGASVNE